MHRILVAIGSLLFGSAALGAEGTVEVSQGHKTISEALKGEFRYAQPKAAADQATQEADPDVVVMDKVVVTDSGPEKRATAAIEDLREKEKKEKFTNATGGRFWKKDVGGKRIELGLTPAGHSSFKILSISWGGGRKR